MRFGLEFAGSGFVAAGCLEIRMLDSALVDSELMSCLRLRLDYANHHRKNHHHHHRLCYRCYRGRIVSVARIHVAEVGHLWAQAS